MTGLRVDKSQTSGGKGDRRGIEEQEKLNQEKSARLGPE